MENKETLIDVSFTGEHQGVKMIKGEIVSINGPLEGWQLGDYDGVTVAYEPEPVAVESLAAALSLNNLPDDRKVITPSGTTVTMGELRNGVKNFDYANSPMATKVVSKRQEAINFISQKDKVKFDFKQMLSKCLEGHKDKNEIIRSIYKIRVLNKAFKHLNVNAKRIALNNYLNNKLMAHSSATGEETLSILNLLRNDNNILDYSILLKNAFEKAVNQKVKLH